MGKLILPEIKPSQCVPETIKDKTKQGENKKKKKDPRRHKSFIEPSNSLTNR